MVRSEEAVRPFVREEGVRRVAKEKAAHGDERDKIFGGEMLTETPP